MVEVNRTIWDRRNTGKTHKEWYYIGIYVNDDGQVVAVAKTRHIKDLEDTRNIGERQTLICIVKI